MVGRFTDRRGFFRSQVGWIPDVGESCRPTFVVGGFGGRGGVVGGVEDGQRVGGSGWRST